MSLTTPKRVLFLSGLWILLAMPLAAGTALIYVTNRGGTTIDVIDSATNKVVQTIGNIESPEVVRFSRDGSQLYIFSRGRERSSSSWIERAGKLSKRCRSAVGPMKPKRPRMES